MGMQAVNAALVLVLAPLALASACDGADNKRPAGTTHAATSFTQATRGADDPCDLLRVLLLQKQ